MTLICQTVANRFTQQNAQKNINLRINIYNFFGLVNAHISYIMLFGASALILFERV